MLEDAGDLLCAISEHIAVNTEKASWLFRGDDREVGPMVLNSCWHPTSLALQADRVGVGANQREAVRGFAYLTAWATKAIRCLFRCRILVHSSLSAISVGVAFFNIS